MKNKEAATTNHMLLRMSPEMKAKIVDGAKKSLRSAHKEALYRLQLAEDIISKGGIHA